VWGGDQAVASGRQLAIAGHHAGSVSSFGKRTVGWQFTLPMAAYNLGRPPLFRAALPRGIGAGEKRHLEQQKLKYYPRLLLKHTLSFQ
jgi:hypothetical protein